MSTDASLATEDLYVALHAVSELEARAESLIAAIPDLADAELLEVRASARHLGSLAWRIECAADHEIARRAVAHGDKELVIADAAREAGVSPRTIYRNAQIHELAQAVPDVDDKQFLTEALAAPDPGAAARMIADKRASDPGYTTRDARADVAALLGGSMVEEVEAYQRIVLALTQDAMRELTRRCTAAHRRPAQIVETWLTRPAPRPALEAAAAELSALCLELNRTSEAIDLIQEALDTLGGMGL